MDLQKELDLLRAHHTAIGMIIQKIESSFEPKKPMTKKQEEMCSLRAKCSARRIKTAFKNDPMVMARELQKLEERNRSKVKL